MTLQQRAIDVIGRLSEDKISQVIRFAEFLSFETNAEPQTRPRRIVDKDGYIRKPGILNVSHGHLRIALVS